MRTTSALLSIICLASLVVLSGCKHVASPTPYQQIVAEPVGVLDVKEIASAPGVFVTSDEIGIPSEIPVRAESKAIKATKPVPVLATPAIEPMRLPTKSPLKTEKENFSQPTPTMAPASGIVEPLSHFKTNAQPIIPVSAFGFAPDLNTPAASGHPAANNLDSVTVMPKSLTNKVIPLEGKASQTIMPVGLKKLSELLNVENIPPMNSVVKVSETRKTTSFTAIHQNEDPCVKLAHAADYRWLIGELDYSSVKKTWRLRYARLDVEDDYGGTVTLTGITELLDNASVGQKVRVEGSIVSENGSPSPRYLVSKLTHLN